MRNTTLVVFSESQRETGRVRLWGLLLMINVSYLCVIHQSIIIIMPRNKKRFIDRKESRTIPLNAFLNEKEEKDERKEEQEEEVTVEFGSTDIREKEVTVTKKEMLFIIKNSTSSNLFKNVQVSVEDSPGSGMRIN